MSTCRLLYVRFSAQPLEDCVLIEELCVLRLYKEPTLLTHKQRSLIRLENARVHLRGFYENIAVEIFDGCRDA